MKVAELKKVLRKHNEEHCVKYSKMKKKQLEAAVQKLKAGPSSQPKMSSMVVKQAAKKKKKKITPMLVAPLSQANTANMFGGNAGTKGQKNTQKAYQKMEKNLAMLQGKDAYPSLGF